jgi:acetyl esterase/lipase
MGLSAALLGCGAPTEAQKQAEKRGAKRASKRVRYGDEHGSQFADLRMPASDPKATVVLLHGGYWLPQYGLDLMNPLAVRFTELGYATWNVEYRRTGAGGGVPATLTDVAAAVDRLAGTGLPSGLTDTVILLGHSAGGHLAAWAASRTARTPGGATKVPLRGAVSLSGVLDLTLAAGDPRSSEPVTAFVGGTPAQVPERYAVADPARLVPPSCPVWAVQAADDDVVSAEQSTTYARLARAAGGRVEALTVPGDHFTLIDPTSEAFPTIRDLVTTIQRSAPDQPR